VLTAKAVEKRAREILRAGKEISPGLYDGILPDELDAILASGIPDALKMLRPFERRPRVTLYRAVVLDDEDLDLRHLGIYWTWHEDYAEPYWGSSGHDATPDDAVLKGVVAHKDIDWPTSAALLVLRGMEEFELRVKRGAPVWLVSVNSRPYKVWGRA